MTTGHARGRNVDLTISFFASREEGWGESRSKTLAKLYSTVPNLN